MLSVSHTIYTRPSNTVDRHMSLDDNPLPKPKICA